jgi:hypothetical protein
MKKTLMVFAALMTAFFMISCQNETTSENNTEEKKDTTAEKVALYKSALSGTSWECNYPEKEGFANYATLAFTDSSIVINSVEYTLDLTKDLFYYSEIPNADNILEAVAEFYIFVKNIYLGFEDWTFANTTSQNKLGVRLPSGIYSSYALVSSSSGSGSDSGSTSTETVTLSGDYTISQANGSTISFSDGNWTYSYLSSSKSGTYSQSGNELTMNYSAGGYSVSAVFTVAKDGDNVKLTGKSGDYSTIVGSAFMVKDSDALTNGVVTLTAK